MARFRPAIGIPEIPVRFALGLRFRLTVSYILFFAVLLAAIGLFFRQTLKSQLVGEAQDALLAALEIDQRVGNKRSESNDLNMLGLVSQHLGDTDTARVYYTRAFEVAQEAQLVKEALGREIPTRAKRSLLANIVTFLPTLIALRGWSLSKDLSQDQYTDGLVEFMMQGLGLQNQPTGG